jgi:hypothetical protein
MSMDGSDEDSLASDIEVLPDERERMLLKKPVGARKTISRPASSSGLQIQQSTGKANIYKTTWMIMGLPGSGKSTLASGFEECLFLVTSEKEVGSLQVPYILIDSWEKTLTVTDELLNNRQKYAQYKFIVIDFVDAIWTMCAIAVCEKLGVAHQTDAQWGKGSDTLDNYFKKWLTALIASSYGVIFISHVVQKDVVSPGGMITKTICSLPQRARNLMFPLVNVIGCIEYKTMKYTDAAGKPVMGKKRVMSFEGNEYIEAKDRDGVLPVEVVLAKDGKKNFEVFKDYYEGRRKK